jgi:serine/threonine protein kinase
MSDKDLGRYKIQKELGRGGMSVVHLALDPHLQRQVAIKVMHPHLAARNDSRKRFLQEATAIARLEHPHVLNVFDYASEEQGAAYIVSEFIDGYTLKEWVDQYGVLHCEVAALLALPIFEALSHAHLHGIIHRDVKPENIMIRKKDAFPILMDFGIAHMVDAETLTVTGAVIGSPAHMAPEVVNGDPLTHSVDIFSMGTVLYWMICNALPFVAPNPAALFRRILEARFDPIQERKPKACCDLAELTERCMQKDTTDRPLTTAIIAETLRKILQQAGLIEIEKELQALAQDPISYQEHLPQRMHVYYVDYAQKALEKGDLTIAIAKLQRAVTLSPYDKKTLSLLHKVQQLKTKKTKGSWHRFMSLLIGMMLIILWWYQPNLSTTRDPIINQAGIAITSSQSLPESLGPFTNNQSRFDPLRKRSSIPLLNAGQHFWDTLTSKSSTITQDTSMLLSTTTANQSIKVKKTFKKNHAFRKYNKRISIIKNNKKKQFKNKKKTPSEVRKITFQKVLIGSRYKGANVWLNGKSVGKVYQIERNQGLPLSLKNSHQITFKMRHCETVSHKVYFTHKAKVLPRISFECHFKPASFKIIGTKNTEIYLRGSENRRLGFTNQEIKYKMKNARYTLSLLLVSPQQKDRAIEVNLLAGELTKIRL